jgi:hypothetical protein
VQHVRRFDAARAQGYGERLIRRVLKGVIGESPPVRVELDPRDDPGVSAYIYV